MKLNLETCYRLFFPCLVACWLTFCLVMGAASAAPVSTSDTAELTLAIQPWVSVRFDEGAFNLLYNSESGPAPSHLTYTAEGNVSAVISIVITQVPDGAPGQWQSSIDKAAFTAGQLLRGNATVTVSGITQSDTPQTYTGGLVTLTISADLD